MNGAQFILLKEYKDRIRVCSSFTEKRYCILFKRNSIRVISVNSSVNIFQSDSSDYL